MSDREHAGGVAFRVAATVGIGVTVYGVLGLLGHASATRPAAAGTWLLGAAVLHDALVAPVACLVGVVLARAIAAPWRAPVRAGLFASACTLAVAWAPLRGYGRATAPDNPSVQPLDYATAVVTVLLVVWALVAVWLVAIAAHRARL